MVIELTAWAGGIEAERRATTTGYR